VRVGLWALPALVVLGLAYLGVGLLAAARLSAPTREPEEATPADVGLDYREVHLQSTDGIELAAWWIPPGRLSRAVVLVPGIEGNRSDPHVLQTAVVYAGEGYGVLMLDLRGQGRSAGERVTMGYREPRDVLGALDWLHGRGYSPEHVVLHGFSMGGATVLRTAPGTGVAAVVEDSAYADLPRILRQRLPEVSGLPAFFTPGVFLAGRIFLGIDPWAVRPERSAHSLCEEGMPLLVIHSKDDEVVPYGHAIRIGNACPRAVVWTLEGYEHVGAYTHPEYRRRLLGFLKAHAFGAYRSPGT
jgi:uncharacterized protein